MIILVTVMVVASRVLSVPIDDISDSNYVATDPSASLPVRIDPATITRLFRDQSSYPVSNPPFEEGFYYTVPARLLLYQPPLGLKTYSQYPQNVPASFGESRQGMTMNSQLRDQNVIATRSVADINNRHQDGWHQSSGSIRNPADNYGMGPSLNSYGTHPHVSSPPPKTGLLFPSYEYTNSQRYGGSSYPDGTVSNKIDADSGHEYQNRRIPIVSSKQSQPILNNRVDIIWDSHDKHLDVVPQSSQIPPSYLAGLEIISKTPSSVTQSRPIWDSPNFPKHMVEPWVSQKNEDSAYSAGRYGLQSRPIDSSSAAVRDTASLFGFRPSLPDNFADIKSKTPWIVLMVPQDSLFRHDQYNEGVKTPRLSLAPKTYGTVDHAGPSFRKEKLDMAENLAIQSSRATTNMKKAMTTDLQHTAAGGLEIHSLLKQEPEESASGSRSLLTSSTTDPQYRNQQPLAVENQGQPVITNWTVAPATVTKYVASGGTGNQRLVGHIGQGRAISSVQNEPATAEEVTSRGKVQSIIDKVVFDGLSARDVTLGSRQLLTGQSDGQTGTKQVIEESGAALSGSTVDEGAHTSSKLISSEGPLGSTQTPGSEALQNVGTEQEIVKKANTVVGGEGSSINTTQSDGLADQQVIQKSNGEESTTTLMGGAPSAPHIVQYVTSEGAVQGQANIESNNAGSSTATRSISSGSAGMQQLEESRAPQIKATLVEGGNSSSQVVHYVTEVGTGMSQPGNMVGGSTGSQQVLEQSNAFSPTTTLSVGAPSSSEIVHYVTTGDAVKEHLGEASMSLKNGGSSAMRRYISENTDNQQSIEQVRVPETLTTQVEGGDSTSQMIRFVTEDHTSTDSVGQESQSASLGYSYMGDTGQQQFTSIEKTSGSNVESTATYLTAAPTSETVIRYVTTADGVRPEIIGEDQSEAATIGVGNVGSSTITRYVTSGSVGNQQITEEGHDPQAVSTHIQGDRSTSQVVPYVTEGSRGIASSLGGIASGNEDHPVATQYNYTGGTRPQKIGDQVEGLGSTITILGGAPTTNKIIRYVTTADGKERQEVVGEELGEAKTALGNGGSTVISYVTLGGTGTQQITEEGQASQNVSVIDGGGPTSKVVLHVIEGSTGTTPSLRYTSVSEGRTVAPKYNYTGVTGPQQVIEQAGSVESTINILREAPTTKKIVRYITTADGVRQEIIGEDEGNAIGSEVTQYNFTDGTGPQQVVEETEGLRSKTPSLGGAPTTKTIVSHITTGDGVRHEIIGDEGDAASGREGHSMVTQHNYTDGTGPQQVIEQANVLGSIKILQNPILGGSPSTSSSTTIIDRPPLSKIIQYVTTEGSVQESMGGLEIVSENVGTTPVNQYNHPGSTGNQIIEGSVYKSEMSHESRVPSSSQLISRYVPKGGMGLESQDLISEHANSVGSTSTLIATGAPATKKIIRIITTADEEEGEEIDNEPNLALENEGLSSGVVSKSTTTLVTPMAPMTENMIHYITTGDGERRQETVDKPNLALENEGLLSRVSPKPTTTLVKTPTTRKIIRYYITTADGVQRREIVDELENEDLSSGVVPMFTTTLMTGAPITGKIMRYITTADGEQRKEMLDENGKLASGVVSQSIKTRVAPTIPSTKKIVRIITTADGEEQKEMFDQSSIPLENEGISSVTGFDDNSTVGTQHIMRAGNTRMIETIPAAAASSSKIIRYVTTAGGARQKIPGESSIVIENDDLVAEGTGQVVVDGNNVESSATLEPSGSQIIRYVNTGGMGTEQLLGQTMIENNGQPSVRQFITAGGAGAQHIEQDGASERTTLVGGNPPTYKTIRYVSNGGSETKQVAETSSANQPSQTVTRYIATMPITGGPVDGQNRNQQGGSTVTRYITVPGSRSASSQFMSGQGNLLSSKTIIGGTPLTVTRYLNYPQQSGVSGTRYMQGFQPGQTSTTIKPAS